MPLECEVLVDPGVAFVRGATVQSAVEFAASLIVEMPTGTSTITFRIVHDVEIARLHAEYFDDPSPTDVISFPSGDDLSERGGHLGDVAISYDSAGAQANEGQHTSDREVAFLALHGMLHLLGHTDSNATQRAAMLALQSRLLDEFDAFHPNAWRS